MRLLIVISLYIYICCIPLDLMYYFKVPPAHNGVIIKHCCSVCNIS